MRSYRSSIRWNGMFSATILAVMSNKVSGLRTTPAAPWRTKPLAPLQAPNSNKELQEEAGISKWWVLTPAPSREQHNLFAPDMDTRFCCYC